MKVVEQTGGRLVFEEKPWLVRLVGLLFVAGGELEALLARLRDATDAKAARPPQS